MKRYTIGWKIIDLYEKQTWNGEKNERISYKQQSVDNYHNRKKNQKKTRERKYKIIRTHESDDVCMKKILQGTEENRWR